MFSFITAWKSNVCTALTSQDAAENISIDLHAKATYTPQSSIFLTGICQLLFKNCWMSDFPLCHHCQGQNCSCNSTTVWHVILWHMFWSSCVQCFSAFILHSQTLPSATLCVILIWILWWRVAGRHVCYLKLNFCHEVSIEVMLLLVILWVMMQWVPTFQSQHRRPQHPHVSNCEKLVLEIYFTSETSA
jgi:hypothetical protein